jgi:hypothetical protein
MLADAPRSADLGIQSVTSTDSCSRTQGCETSVLVLVHVDHFVECRRGAPLYDWVRDTDASDDACLLAAVWRLNGR